jgi:hypothetical protein
MMRKGLTKGSGRIGYYNVIAKDPMVHRMSAKGIKQPQTLSMSFGGKAAKKVGVKYIEIRRAEGNKLYDPKLGIWIRYDNLKQADGRLREISKTAPMTGGYDKTDVKVVFDDGFTYEGRWDVKHFSQPNADLSIGDHIRDELNFYAGNTERGKKYIESMGLQNETKKYQKALKKWDLGGKGGKALPTLTYRGKVYYVDFRLGELRNVRTAEPIRFTDIGGDVNDPIRHKLRALRFRTYDNDYIAGVDDVRGEMMKGGKLSNPLWLHEFSADNIGTNRTARVFITEPASLKSREDRLDWEEKVIDNLERKYKTTMRWRSTGSKIIYNSTKGGKLSKLRRQYDRINKNNNKFHDWRNDAITRYAKKGNNVIEIVDYIDIELAPLFEKKYGYPFDSSTSSLKDMALRDKATSQDFKAMESKLSVKFPPLVKDKYKQK